MEGLLRNRIGTRMFLSHKILKRVVVLISLEAYFNIMLRDFGVEGVKVQEIVSLDEELLVCLP